jgi:hypothetical protein
MFWGVSMANEEQKWRNAQPPMPAEGTRLGNERQGEDEPMDVDMSEEEVVSEEDDDDDDIIEGCHILEIDIKARVSRTQKIGYVPNTYEYTTLSGIATEILDTPIWHQPSSQANRESVSPDVPLSHGLSYTS